MSKGKRKEEKCERAKEIKKAEKKIESKDKIDAKRKKSKKGTMRSKYFQITTGGKKQREKIWKKK